MVWLPDGENFLVCLFVLTTHERDRHTDTLTNTAWAALMHSIAWQKLSSNTVTVVTETVQLVLRQFNKKPISG